MVLPLLNLSARCCTCALPGRFRPRAAASSYHRPTRTVILLLHCVGVNVEERPGTTMKTDNNRTLPQRRRRPASPARAWTVCATPATLRAVERALLRLAAA